MPAFGWRGNHYTLIKLAWVGDWNVPQYICFPV
jgi:hypothetical protein